MNDEMESSWLNSIQPSYGFIQSNRNHSNESNSIEFKLVEVIYGSRT